MSALPNKVEHFSNMKPHSVLSDQTNKEFMDFPLGRSGLMQVYILSFSQLFIKRSSGKQQRSLKVSFY